MATTESGVLSDPQQNPKPQSQQFQAGNPLKPYCCYCYCYYDDDCYYYYYHYYHYYYYYYYYYYDVHHYYYYYYYCYYCCYCYLQFRNPARSLQQAADTAPAGGFPGRRGRRWTVVANQARGPRV